MLNTLQIALLHHGLQFLKLLVLLQILIDGLLRVDDHVLFVVKVGLLMMQGFTKIVFQEGLYFLI